LLILPCAGKEHQNYHALNKFVFGEVQLKHQSNEKGAPDRVHRKGATKKKELEVKLFTKSLEYRVNIGNISTVVDHYCNLPLEASIQVVK
jgi:hypothetical protein